MTKITLKALFEFKIFGIDNNDEKFKRLMPLEPVTSIEYPVDSDKIIVHSETRQLILFKRYYEPVKQIFKDTDMYLSQEVTSKSDEVRKCHILVFHIARGYHALLMGILKED